MRKFLVLALAALPLAFLTGSEVDGTPVGGDSMDLSGGIALLKREPVLNFDVTGSTLIGAFHTRYTVYNDGLVTGSSCGGFGGENSAGTTFAPISAVIELQKALNAAGGFTLQDQNLSVSDLPLTTVSVFKGATDARCHTFSYWIGEPYDEIGTVIADFMSKYPVTCESIFR